MFWSLAGFSPVEAGVGIQKANNFTTTVSLMQSMSNKNSWTVKEFIRDILGPMPQIKQICFQQDFRLILKSPQSIMDMHE